MIPPDVLVILILGSCGITFVITRSVLLHPFRERVYACYGESSLASSFVRCPQCVGFWVGFVVFVVYSFYSMSIEVICFCILFGMCVSFICYLVDIPLGMSHGK